jgi:hypothetical protein
LCILIDARKIHETTDHGKRRQPTAAIAWKPTEQKNKEKGKEAWKEIRHGYVAIYASKITYIFQK